jgi:hypothetical protein
MPATVLKRKAVVYVRQSTQGQVQSNLAGKRRQYARNALRSSTDGLARSYGNPKPLEQWAGLLKDHHDGYIDWAEFERNQKQLPVNAFGRREV